MVSEIEILYATVAAGIAIDVAVCTYIVSEELKKRNGRSLLDYVMKRSRSKV